MRGLFLKCILLHRFGLANESSDAVFDVLNDFMLFQSKDVSTLSQRTVHFRALLNFTVDNIVCVALTIQQLVLFYLHNFNCAVYLLSFCLTSGQLI